MRGAAVLASLLLLAGAAFAGPTGSGTAHISYAKRAEIGFAPGAEAISPVVRSQIARAAAVLKADLAASPCRVEVQAYAPTSKARVLALQRAIDVRLALVENGVPAARIDVRVTNAGTSPDVVVISIRRAPSP